MKKKQHLFIYVETKVLFFSEIFESKSQKNSICLFVFFICDSAGMLSLKDEDRNL